MQMYMGRDKYENEDLIKYGFPEDVWFHVDNLSSAHVYLRLPKASANATVAAPPNALFTLNKLSSRSLSECRRRAWTGRRFPRKRLRTVRK